MSSKGPRTPRGRLTALHPTTQYAEDVRAGRELAGPYVRLACERHLRDLALGKWTFDVDRADHILEFFPNVLRLPDTEDEYGDPMPFALLPFWQFIVGSLFGWVDSDRIRRFREGYIESGKGSGKTPVLAGIGLYGLVLDGERAAEIYSAAVDRDQASIMFRDATRIVEASPSLADCVKVSVGNLAYAPTMSFFRCFSREQGQKSGYRPFFALIDEIHEHKTGEIVTKIKAGVKRRREPLVLEITNSGFDRSSICWAHHEHARRVLQGLITDDRFFAYVCALDEGDDPLTDRRCWPKTNPGLGTTVTADYLERRVQTANDIPMERDGVLRLNFCVWTRASKREIDPVKWGSGGAVVSPDELLGAPCYAGLDLGQTDDMSSLVLVFPLEDGRHVVYVWFWMPEGALEANPDRPYTQWQAIAANGAPLVDVPDDEGLMVSLRVTEGTMTDMDRVEEDVQQICEHFGARELAYDKRFAAQMAQHLEGAGITCIDTPQGFQLNEPNSLMSRLYASGNLLHGQHAILAWQAENYTTRTGRMGEKRPDKPNAKGKIDGMVALLMALDRIIRSGGGDTSVYDDPAYQAIDIEF